jgi:cobalt-zinc-cadmium efflux system outer membrane protein
MVHLRTWWALALVPLIAGCTLKPQWPDPELDAARLTGESEPIVIDTTGGALDAPALNGESLRRADAIRMALTTSPAIQAALARVRQAYAEAHQERLLPNPVLTVVLKFPTSGGAPTVEPGIAADLLALLQKPGKVEAADHRLRASSAEAVVVVLDVLTQVQDRYAQVQALEAVMPVLEERRRLTDRLLEVARSRLKGGEGTRLDVTTLETQKVELEVEIAEQQLERREARLELARLIGRPSGSTEWRLDGWSEPALGGLDERAWVQAGLDHRPEVTAKMWELKALGVEFRQARWGVLEGTEVGVDAEGTAESGADDWLVGPSLVVPLPIFDWGQAKRDLITARRLEFAHQLTETRRQVVEDVRRAHAAFRSVTDARKRVRDALIPLLERRRGEAESQYRAGQNDVIPLILADQDLQTARAKLIELERRTAVSHSRLQRAVGGSGVLPASAASQPASTSAPTTQPGN